MNIFPVIMAGGSGTRFWPLSRVSRPKQFLPLASDKPLIVDTLERLAPIATAKESFVVCGPIHADNVKSMLPAMPAEHVIVEPVARNTAPAIGLAAIHVAHVDPKGILLILPSDHHIGDTEEFCATLKAAARLADEGMLTTIGITPTRPDTGFGYIHLGQMLGEREGFPANKVQRFVEKPDLDRAKEYVRSADYLWNAGIFAFRADVILAEIDRHLPKLSAALKAIAPTIGQPAYEATLAKHFPESEPISIDYGVMERAETIACVPGRFSWSDVGSFAALHEVRPLDGQGNVSQGDNVFVDSRNCVVVGQPGRPIAVVGLTDIVIVDAGDAILVVPKDRAQEVRAAVDALARKGAKQYL